MILKGKTTVDLLEGALQIAADLAYRSGIPDRDNEYRQLLSGIEKLGQVSAIKLSGNEVNTCIDALEISLDVDEEMFYPLLEYMQSNISPQETSAKATELRGQFSGKFISVQRGDQTILLRPSQLQYGDVVSVNRRLAWVKGWNGAKKSWELEPVSFDDIQLENPIANIGANMLKRLVKVLQ